MAKTYSEEQLNESRDLRGQLTPGKTLENMTSLEQAVLRHQGLVDDNDQIKPEAFTKVEEPINLPPHIPSPVPLEDLEPDMADRISEAVSEARGAAADEADVDPEMQVDAPLPPPDTDDVMIDDFVDDGFGASTKMDVGVLLRGAKEPVRCPRCTYDVRKHFADPDFEQSDKATFIRHVMSRNGRFEKRFPILDGHGAIIMRSRSQSEMERIFKYVRSKLQDEELLPGSDYITQIERYHIAASVAAIESNDPADSEKFPTLDYLAQDKDCADPVGALENMVFGSGRSAGLFSIVTALWMEFERLYGWFSSKAHEPDFWKAAVGSHS